MQQGINLTSVFISDFIGIMMLLLILFTKGFYLPMRKQESRLLFILIIATLIDCMVDPFAFYYDGKPGVFSYWVSFICNSILYLYNLIVGSGVLFLVSVHIHKEISAFRKYMVMIMFLIETSLLVINCFRPIVFYINDNNVYERRGGYIVFLVFGLTLVMYGLIIYIVARVRDGSLRYFPVWHFLIPITICIFIQTKFYGISIQPVGFAISFTAIIICLQNESLYIDKLTGVYNRFELEKVISAVKRKKNKKIAAIMLDLNDFKKINDEYSHSEGDSALIALANIISNAVSNNGVVVRFAGDEFIVVITNAVEDTVKEYIDKINLSIALYNKNSGKPYQLSAAIGGGLFDLSCDDEIDFMKKIDELMYVNKREYYKTHERRGKR